VRYVCARTLDAFAVLQCASDFALLSDGTNFKNLFGVRRKEATATESVGSSRMITFKLARACLGIR
jgi:hypothetical protein